MANNLMSKLSKLRHDRHITEEEYAELVKKLDGHDKQVRENAIDECINSVENCVWKDSEMLVDMLKELNK